FFLKLGRGPDAPILYGLIDRIQRRPSGEVEIVDYKTHRHLKSRDEVMADLQLPIYVIAAREALGYSPTYATMAFVRHATWYRFRVDELDLDGVRRWPSSVTPPGTASGSTSWIWTARASASTARLPASARTTSPAP